MWLTLQLEPHEQEVFPQPPMLIDVKLLRVDLVSVGIVVCDRLSCSLSDQTD